MNWSVEMRKYNRKTCQGMMDRPKRSKEREMGGNNPRGSG